MALQTWKLENDDTLTLLTLLQFSTMGYIVAPDFALNLSISPVFSAEKCGIILPVSDSWT